MFLHAGRTKCGSCFSHNHIKLPPQQGIAVFGRRPSPSSRRLTSQRLSLACQCSTSQVGWEQASKLRESGTICQGAVKAINKGGVIIQFEDFQGFIPFSCLDQSRLQENEEETLKKRLMGQQIRAKVIEVDEEGQRLVLSEKAVLLDEASSDLNVGDVVQGVVTGLADYGAFVDIRLKDGLLHGVTGLIHKSELSWNKVSTPDAVLNTGDEVTVVVTEIDQELGHFKLSLRQAQRDPLQETLDTLFPISEASVSGLSWTPGGTPLVGLDTIVSALLAEEGVQDVQLGRQAQESKVVSQDLELWLTKEEVADGYNVVARAGRQLQEMHITTNLTREQMKDTLDRTLRQTL